MNIDPLLSALQTNKTGYQTDIARPAFGQTSEVPLSTFRDMLTDQISAQSQQINNRASLALHPHEIHQAAHQRGFISQMVGDVARVQNHAADAAQEVMEGKGSLHSAMIAMEEAGVSFQLLVEARNKVVESLQELMRMQI
jgi:flagellar hook-basal body complex protein FliE